MTNIELSTLLAGIVVIIIVLTGFSLITGDLVNTYNITGYSDLDDNYNGSYINRVSELSEQMSNKTQKDRSQGAIGEILGIPRGAFDSIILFFTVGDIGVSFIGDVMVIMGIPVEISTLLNLIFIIFVLGAILAIFLRRQGVI